MEIRNKDAPSESIRTHLELQYYQTLSRYFAFNPWFQSRGSNARKNYYVLKRGKNEL